MLKSTKFENLLSETELNRVAKLASSFDEKFSESFARIDGWVCRNDGDCNWLDKHLQCETNGFSLSQITGAWPWKQELRGRCSCQNGYLFERCTIYN